MPEEGGNRPVLMALLICEEVMLDESGIASLIKVVDTFNCRVEVQGEPMERVDLSFPLNCMLFTRWGLGEGEFVEEVALVSPGGTENPQRAVTRFTKPSGFHFQQIRHVLHLMVAQEGIYKWRVYLNGELIMEHPFKVNITVVARSESKPSVQEAD